MKIRGNTVGTSNPKPDWNQKNANKADFIKNKPDGNMLPAVTAADNGKLLQVVNGVWTASQITDVSQEGM